MDGTFVVSARYPDCVTRIVPHVPLVLIGANIGAKAMRNARNRWNSSRAVDAPQLHDWKASGEIRKPFSLPFPVGFRAIR